MKTVGREGNWYAGFSPNERSEHLKAQKSLIAAGELAPANGPCGICGDPDTPVEFHSEDYAQPYRWTPPAADQSTKAEQGPVPVIDEALVATLTEAAKHVHDW